MGQQTTEMKHSEQQAEAKHFVQRVISLPYVQESVAYANQTSLGRFANSTLTAVSQNQIVQNAYVNFVQPHVDRADALGCRSLDLLQAKTATLTRTVETYFPVADEKASQAKQLINDQRTKLLQSLEMLQSTLRQSAILYAEAAQQRLAVPQQRIQDLTAQITAQFSAVLSYLKTQPIPDWLQARVMSLLDIANKQYELIREQYNRSDINSYEKARQLGQGLQSQVLPVLQNIQSQLAHYTEKTGYLRSYIKLPHVVSASQ
ncbi:hypothetical protein BX666DRAFT_1873467 [Dichotomocladium elegans]|nr:hypothetical protein BX666DRAFT_1873467 [Dichotomocladium elegans]